jgi:hypothetical protein
VDISERKRAVSNLFWRAWIGVFIANTVGGATFGTILAVSVGVYAPGFPYNRLISGLQDPVAALGGEITVRSPQGDGTRIIAVIPCA